MISKMRLNFLAFAVLAWLGSSHLSWSQVYYSDRPDITKLKPKSQPAKSLEPVWGDLKPVLPDTLALLLEGHPDHAIYFLARDGELLYDYAKIVLKDDPAALKRINLINISRLNMVDPNLEKYLAQEGISEKALKDGKKFLFVDTGFSGTIPKKIESMFPEKFRSQLNTQLLLSETSTYPSAKVFLNGVSDWANYLTPDELHGKIIAMEKLPHFSERSDRFEKVNGKWEAVSTVSDARGGAVSGDLAKKYQQDLMVFADSSESKKKLADKRKIWNKIISLEEKGDKAKLVSYLTKLKNDSKGDRFVEALIKDYIDISTVKNKPQSILVTSSDLGLSNVGSSKSARLEQVKKDLPELKKVFSDPQNEIPKMMKKGEYKKLEKLSELGLHDYSFRTHLIKELGKGELTPEKTVLLKGIIEESQRETLESLPSAIFSKSEIVKNPEISSILKRYIHLAEEDAIDNLLEELVASPHFAQIPDAPELLRDIMLGADEENLELLNELFNGNEHLRTGKLAEFKKASSINNKTKRAKALEKIFVGMEKKDAELACPAMFKSLTKSK